jgi:hypothetical protein
MIKNYQLGVLLILFTSIIITAIGLITGNAAANNLFQDPAFSATMWELAGLLTGGGLLLAVGSPILWLLLWFLDRTAPANTEQTKENK